MEHPPPFPIPPFHVHVVYEWPFIAILSNETLARPSSNKHNGNNGYLSVSRKKHKRFLTWILISITQIQTHYVVSVDFYYTALPFHTWKRLWNLLFPLRATLLITKLNLFTLEPKRRWHKVRVHAAYFKIVKEWNSKNFGQACLNQLILR